MQTLKNLFAKFCVKFLAFSSSFRFYAQEMLECASHECWLKYTTAPLPSQTKILLSETFIFTFLQCHTWITDFVNMTSLKYWIGPLTLKSWNFDCTNQEENYRVTAKLYNPQYMSFIIVDPNKYKFCSCVLVLKQGWVNVPCGQRRRMPFISAMQCM